jgi:hypothetical protein
MNESNISSLPFSRRFKTYIEQKKDRERDLEIQQRLLVNLEHTYIEIKYKYNALDDADKVKKDIDDLKEKIRYNVWFDRDDTIRITHEKSFEKRVGVILYLLRIMTFIVLLYYWRKILSNPL